MKHPSLRVLLLAAGLVVPGPAHLVAQAPRLHPMLTAPPSQPGPTGGGRDSLPPASVGEAALALTASPRPGPRPGALPEIRRADGNNTFPKWTLVGAAIGGVVFGGYAIVAGGGGNLLPGTRERLLFVGSVGLGALIGYAFDVD